MEKVSIIIALYNAENYIAETLLSVKHQTWENIEIIVVNDGSKDKSAEVVESLKLENLKLYNNKNAGQCAASNFGIKQANGELVKFLDADDLLKEDCIEKMVLKYRENKNRLVFGEWHYFIQDLSHVKWNHSSIYKDYEKPLDFYLDTLDKADSMLAGWMWLIPKSILEKAGGWDERLHLMNDFEFSTRLLLNSDGVGFAEGAIHYYRKGLSSAMTSHMNRRIAESIFTGVFEAHNNVLKFENSPRVRLAFANQFQNWVYQFYPNYKDLSRKMELLIDDLEGSTLKPEGGRLFYFLNRFLPWKWVAYIQWTMHKTIWKPILKFKENQKLKKQFNVD
ncbi:glycosyltransferase [Mangrovimonas sp. AS39]|uniref:glycosyltransferase family 2 protein n=1 Tax=Mangrovimonas futianensis TaxID=2895523 RepID=UPI001E4F3434|nr:glycosyltransferase family 2 protein [Mangrovimonas futianensis]MCF1190802.1 glycosyltransferase [Mangrovimonas futianensis]MCF1194499.1 glycosyltransferase [Mangrovimonas futianensis]